MLKRIVILTLCAVLLTGCTSKPEPIEINSEKFSVKIPGDWKKQVSQDDAVIMRYDDPANKMRFVAYQVKLDTKIDPSKIAKDNCDRVYANWISNSDTKVVKPEGPKVEYVKYENESKPHCRISYRFDLQASASELEKQNLNKYQWENLKVYFYEDVIIIGLFVRSGEGETSDYFETIYDIQDSFLPK